jgi:hypothetical protein
MGFLPQTRQQLPPLPRRHEAAAPRLRGGSPFSPGRLEVVDQNGAGFRTLLEWEQGMDLALRVAVAVTRLRGIGTT